MTTLVTLTHLPITEPTILTDPYKGSHVLRWNKSRGQPETSRLVQCASRETFSLSIDDDDISSSCTPYRLPRLSPRESPNLELEHMSLPDERKDPVTDKVWSRYGYEKIIRIPELGPQVRVLIPPPRQFLQPCPRTAGTPRFKNAAITPTVKSLPWSLGREMDDVLMYKNNQSRVHDDDMSTRSTRLEPTPTPISRSDSPAKSVKSIHWILGHNRYHTFDKTGRSHIQGPYSREFNVTCMAPQNWLKMKWGRSKTMIH